MESSGPLCQTLLLASSCRHACSSLLVELSPSLSSSLCSTVTFSMTWSSCYYLQHLHQAPSILLTLVSPYTYLSFSITFNYLLYSLLFNPYLLYFSHQNMCSGVGCVTCVRKVFTKWPEQYLTYGRDSGNIVVNPHVTENLDS